MVVIPWCVFSIVVVWVVMGAVDGEECLVGNGGGDTHDKNLFKTGPPP